MLSTLNYMSRAKALVPDVQLEPKELTPSPRELLHSIKQVYLGNTVYPKRSNTSIPYSSRTVLRQLNIPYDHDCGYHQGLATLNMKYKLWEIHQHMESRLQELRADSKIAELLVAISYCRAAITYLLDHSADTQAAINELNLQLEQLGMLFLPSDFLENMLSPLLFMELTGRKIGIMMEMRLYAGDRYTFEESSSGIPSGSGYAGN